MLINSVPNLISALLLLKLPESPKFLYQSGKFDETLKIMKRMYSSNSGKPEYTFPVLSLDEKMVLISDNEKKSVLKELAEQIAPLFKPPLLTYTFVICFLQAAAFAFSAGVYVWYPNIVKQISNSGKVGVTVCEALSIHNTEDSNTECNSMVSDSVFILSIIIGLAYLVGFTVWGVVVKLLGTKIFYSKYN